MPQNIGDNVINPVGIARITEADAERLSRYLLHEGDIVYARRGDVEKRALVRSENVGWLCGTGCLRVRLGSGAAHDARFLSYALGTDEVRAWIVRHAVGATMPNLNTSILSAVPLRVPEPAVQRAVAAVLGALDDKIAANERLAETADALVRAKFQGLGGAAGRTTIGALASNVRDSVDPVLIPPTTLYVGLEHIRRRSMWLDNFGQAGDVASGKTRLAAGDVLFGKLRPYFHKVVSSPERGICSTDILVVRAIDPGLRGFLLAACASDEVVKVSTASSEGTRMPRTSWNDLAKIEVPWPSEATARIFSRDVDGIRMRVDAAITESRALAAVRDALLPELMSGRLRLKDAEQIVEQEVS